MDPFFQAQHRATKGGLPWGRTGDGYIADVFSTFGHGNSRLEWERTSARKEAELKRRFAREQAECMRV